MKISKLAAIYNVFDGEELLEGSIKSIRNQVDVVIVVYQIVSNWGNRNDELLPLIDDLRCRGLIDIAVFFQPKEVPHPHFNETEKRRKGYITALKENCTHFLFMDCDEYYFENQFKEAKEIIANENYSGSACQIATYYNQPEYLIQPHYTYYVPFIHQVQEAMKIGLAQDRYPVCVDPTRKCSAIQKLWIIRREMLEMQHYSYIRKDIAKKLYNSSARDNFNDIYINIEKFNTFKIGDELIYFGKQHKIKEVTNHFNINLYGSTDS